MASEISRRGFLKLCTAFPAYLLTPEAPQPPQPPYALYKVNLGDDQHPNFITLTSPTPDSNQTTSDLVRILTELDFQDHLTEGTPPNPNFLLNCHQAITSDPINLSRTGVLTPVPGQENFTLSSQHPVYLPPSCRPELFESWLHTAQSAPLTPSSPSATARKIDTPWTQLICGSALALVALTWLGRRLRNSSLSESTSPHATADESQAAYAFPAEAYSTLPLRPVHLPPPDLSDIPYAATSGSGVAVRIGAHVDYLHERGLISANQATQLKTATADGIAAAGNTAEILKVAGDYQRAASRHISNHYHQSN